MVFLGGGGNLRPPVQKFKQISTEYCSGRLHRAFLPQKKRFSYQIWLILVGCLILMSVFQVPFSSLRAISPKLFTFFQFWFLGGVCYVIAINYSKFESIHGKNKKKNEKFWGCLILMSATVEAFFYLFQDEQDVAV